jgi:DHA1 family bicyclomycin/chloramphenicol resistance-like MFS transporter
VTWTLAAQVGISSTVLILSALPLPLNAMFVVFLLWQTSLFFMAGTTIGNLNAIAMEPMGHIAGMAASVIGAIATIVAAALASIIALLFDGTLTLLAGAVIVMSAAGFGLMRIMRRAELALPA